MIQMLLAVAGLMAAGLLSPGPNFVLISGRAMSSGTGPAVATACGVSIGSLTHALLGVAGFGALLQSSMSLFTIAKLLGAAYLLWTGFKSVRGAVRSIGRSGVGPAPDRDHRPVGMRRSVVDGYLTQMSNPKSTLFFLAMFTSVVPSDVTVWQATTVIATVGVVAFGGYILIAAVLSRPVFQSAYRRAGAALDAMVGLAMMALGIRVAAT